MKRHIRPIVIFLVVAFGALLLGGSSRWSTAAQNPTVNRLYIPVSMGDGNGVRIPETTEVLSDITLQYLSSVSVDNRVFTFEEQTAELAELDVGDVMVGSVSAEAPNGFLREVTDVKMVGGGVTVETVQATLEQAIETGSLRLSRALSPNDIRSTYLAAGVEMDDQQRLGESPNQFSYTLDEFVIFDRDGNTGSTDDQIVADGYVSLTQEIDFGFDIRFFKLHDLDFVVTSDTNTELRLTAHRGLQVQLVQPITLARHVLAPIVGTIGPVPVVILPEVELVIGADGAVNAVTTFGVQQTTHTEAGLRFTNGDWQPVAKTDVDFKPLPVNISAEFSLRAHAGPELALNLYGVAGPYAAAELYGELVSEHATAPAYRLYAGLAVPVGVKLKIVSRVYADFGMTVIDLRHLIAEVGFGTNRPPYEPDSPTPSNSAGNQPLGVRLAWSGGDPDGDDVSYDVLLESNDDTPDTLTCNSTYDLYCDVDGLLPNTTYFWQVIAEDDSNAVTVGPVWQFSTGGSQNAPPYKPSDPDPPHNSIDALINTPLTWTGGDPDADSVTYDVFLAPGTSIPSTIVCNDVDRPSCLPSALTWDTTYSWQVIARDQHGLTSTGDVWQFRTRSQPEGPATMDIALILDSSGSMQTTDPNRLRVAAANVFADTMLNGDQAAVIGFDTNSYVPFPLQLLGNDRNPIRAAINSIGQSGGSTNIVAALNAGYSQLSGSPTAVPKAAVLLTDGLHNQGSWQTNSYTQYATKGWPVFTIGLSNRADDARLRDIASATGGQYYALTDPSQLVQIYFTIQAAVTGSTITTNSSFQLQQNETRSLTSTIADDQNAVSFVTTWPGSEVNTTLIDPDGRVITPTTASTDPLVYHAKGDTYEVYRVDYPTAGEWTIETFGADLPSGGELVTVQVSQRDDVLPTGSWKEVSAGSASGGGISNTPGDSVWPDIVSTDNGSIYAVWSEEIQKKGEIYVRRWNGTGWVDVGLGSAAGGGISDTDGASELPVIAVGPDGAIYVAWQEADQGATDIYVKRWDGTSWQELGGSASQGGISQTNRNSEWPDIEVSHDNLVYVAWRESEAADNEIYVRRWNGSNWVSIGGSADVGGISQNSGDSGRLSLAITSQGVPYVAWTDATAGDTEIYIRRLVGTTWEEVGNGSATGGGLSNNAGASRTPTLATDSNDQIYVVWPDNSGGVFDVLALRWDGSTWTELGQNAQAGGVSQSPGNTFSPRIAVAPDNTPYVTWFDNSPGSPEIYVRRWTGVVWEEAGTGAATGSGISSSQGASAHSRIAVTPDGIPFIIWNDNTSGDHEIYIKHWSP